MAFSTQKDFLEMSLADSLCSKKKSETKLKTYESCRDFRAWTLNRHQNARYVADVVDLKKNDCASGAGDGSEFYSRECLENLSREDLVEHVLALYENIRSKNCELKRTEKLLREVTERFKAIGDVVKEKSELEDRLENAQKDVRCLKENQSKVQKELLSAVEANHTLREENTALVQASRSRISDEEVCELRRRSEILDRMLVERNNLAQEMQKNKKVEEAIMQLAKKAKMADCLMMKNQELMKSLQCLQEETSPSAKLVAENRYLQDRIAEVEALEEEIAIYKARTESLNRKLNDLKQRAIEASEVERELMDSKLALARRDAELHDCEENIGRLVMTVEAQKRELCCKKTEICKLQKDVRILFDYYGIDFEEDLKLCTEKDDLEAPLAGKKSITGPIEVQNDELLVCKKRVEELQKELDGLRDTPRATPEASTSPAFDDSLLRKENEELKATIKSLEEKIKELVTVESNEIKDVGGCEALEAENRLLKQQLNDKTAQIHGMEQDLQVLRSSEAESKKLRLELEAEKKKNEGHLTHQSAIPPPNSTAVREENVSENQKEVLEEVSREKEKSLQLEKELKALQAQLEQQKGAKADCDKVLRELEEEKSRNQKLQSENQDLQQSLQTETEKSGKLEASLLSEKQKTQEALGSSVKQENEPVSPSEDQKTLNLEDFVPIAEFQRLQKQLEEEMATTRELEELLRQAKRASIVEEVPRSVPETSEELEALRKENAQLRQDVERCQKTRSVSEIPVEEGRGSFEGRFSAKIGEMQQLHENQMRDVQKRHETEMEALQLQYELLRKELERIEERCKCGQKKPRLFSEDERLIQICRDAEEYGLEPVCLPDLKYLQDLVEREVRRKESIAQYGEDLSQNIDKLFQQMKSMVKDSEKRVEVLKKQVDLDHFPTKLPFMPQQSPQSSRLQVPPCCRKVQQTVRGSSGKKKVVRSAPEEEISTIFPCTTSTNKKISIRHASQKK